MSTKLIKPLVLILLSALLLSGCTLIQVENKSSQSEETQTVVSSKTETKEEITEQTAEQLKTIKSLAEEGKALGSDFTADGTKNITDAYALLGEPKQPEMWIGDAKGLYSVYEKEHLVFGSNKGGAIFEIRSTSPDLKAIGYQDVIKAYGEPDKTNNTESETIIGYKINDRFKLLLVFPKLKAANDNPSLDHYSVFYPKGTVNHMADDPGREW